MDRLANKVAVVVGAGQASGQGVGNGRATAQLFARHGAKVACIDQSQDAAQETADLIIDEGSQAIAFAADVTDEAALKAMVESVTQAFGSIDVLHNNVGVSIAGGDAVLEELTESAFDNVFAINLRGMMMTCKHVIPVMQQAGRGSIVNISSTAVQDMYPFAAYKASKAGVVAFTEQLAYRYAAENIRANVILPGLIDTPMAVDTRAREWQQPREQIAAARDARVPLGKKMGSAWDVANAALFLASDEAKFITGVTLPVDGGANVFTSPQ
jgi:NAD(P)-dependent dehydrogenase (short-subunit alcohol dehydrogenase family)